MADLRELFESLGFEDVVTYIQSGNIVFDTDLGEESIVGQVTEAFGVRFGFDTSLILRTAEEMEEIATVHPLSTSDIDPRFLLVAFLDQTPSVDFAEAIDPSTYEPDQLLLRGREVYLRYPNGSGRSKLTNSLIEKRLGMRSTARNWNSVRQLAALAAR
jgi:uncharacterized protein (DUF1697 family)